MAKLRHDEIRRMVRDDFKSVQAKFEERLNSQGLHPRMIPALTENLDFIGDAIAHQDDESMGDRDIAGITRRDTAELKKIKQALPANRKTKRETRDLTLTEAVAVPGLKRIAVKTVNSHIDTFRRFFDWAERHGLAPLKLFDGMTVAKPKHDDTGRVAFSKEDARVIHAELTENRSGLVRKPACKWGALLGLYTGARLREIAQLDVADIRKVGDLWHIDINEDGEKKSLKTPAAKRRVPLHPDLIELGFLAFVEEQRGQQARLFPEFSYNKQDGYGRNLGRWFNTSFLPKIGLKAPGVVFHCLRHTMVTRLAQAGVPEPLYQEIVGHERQGVTQQNYLKEGHTLAQKMEALERFRV